MQSEIELSNELVKFNELTESELENKLNGLMTQISGICFNFLPDYPKGLIFALNRIFRYLGGIEELKFIPTVKHLIMDVKFNIMYELFLFSGKQAQSSQIYQYIVKFGNQVVLDLSVNEHNHITSVNKFDAFSKWINPLFVYARRIDTDQEEQRVEENRINIIRDIMKIKITMEQ